MSRAELKAYGHLLKGLFSLARVILFEKFTAVFFFFYLLFVLSLGFLLSVVHWSVAAVVVFLGLALFLKVLKSFQFLKRSLIRKGDRIEYADPYASDNMQMFQKATVLLKMRLDEVKKTRLIPDELIEGNRHFYLVETGQKPTVVAYDWIIGLSPEVLD